MEQNIKKILEDLYQLEPSLRKDEEKLKQIISNFLVLKPQFKIDANFVENLRQELKVKFEEKKSSLFSSTEEKAPFF